MTKEEILNAYRTAAIELDELRAQLERTGTDGRPSGCRSMQTDRIGFGTNAPNAAALQLADGLEALAARKEEELRTLSASVDQILSEIQDYRTYMVILYYYVHGQKDEQIGMLLSITRCRANQIRRAYLKGL